jgi:solute carrier family 25 citrate transporter 1
MAPVEKPKHPGKAIVAGGISGAFEICCTYPLEFTKTVAQLDKGGGGAMGVIRNTMRNYGPLGFYRGLSTMVYFATPKAAIRFSAFEQASSALRDKDGKPMFGGFTGFVAGLVAGTFEAIFVTTPQETIKIKLIDDAFVRETPRYNGFFHGVSTIVSEVRCLHTFYPTPRLFSGAPRAAPGGDAALALAPATHTRPVGAPPPS